MRRIDIVKTFTENEKQLFDEVCPDCYHLLNSILDEEHGVGDYLYCPNEMCLNEEHFSL